MRLIHLSNKKVVADVFTKTRKIDPGHKMPMASNKALYKQIKSHLIALFHIK